MYIPLGFGVKYSIFQVIFTDPFIVAFTNIGLANIDHNVGAQHTQNTTVKTFLKKPINFKVQFGASNFISGTPDEASHTLYALGGGSMDQG